MRSKPSTLAFDPEVLQFLDSQYCHSDEDRHKWSCKPDWHFIDNVWCPSQDPFTTVFNQTSKISGEVWVSAHTALPFDILNPLLRNKPHLKNEWRILRFNNESAMMSSNRVIYDTLSNKTVAVPQCIGFEYVDVLASSLSAILGLEKDTFHTKKGWEFRALVVGLGGGSLPQVLARHFPVATIDVVEIEPAVVASAHEALGMLEAPNINIVVADVVDYLNKMAKEEPNAYDFIFMDAYDAKIHLPESLKGPKFAATVSENLNKKRGTLMMNFIDDIGIYPVTETYKAAIKIDEKVDFAYRVNCEGSGNHLLIASRSLKAAIGADKGNTPEDMQKLIQDSAAKVVYEVGMCIDGRKLSSNGFKKV